MLKISESGLIQAHVCKEFVLSWCRCQNSQMKKSGNNKTEQ